MLHYSFSWYTISGMPTWDTILKTSALFTKTPEPIPLKFHKSEEKSWFHLHPSLPFNMQSSPHKVPYYMWYWWTKLLWVHTELTCWKLRCHTRTQIHVVTQYFALSKHNFFQCQKMWNTFIATHLCALSLTPLFQYFTTQIYHLVNVILNKTWYCIL